MSYSNSERTPDPACGIAANSGFLNVSRSVFWRAHPATIRMLLALASLGWFLCILLGAANVGPNNYRYMWMIMPEWLWAVLFLFHFAGTFWRLFDPEPRVGWALGLNILGFLLWFMLTCSTNFAAGHFIPGSCLEVVTCGFAAWALIRTGVGKDVRTP